MSSSPFPGAAAAEARNSLPKIKAPHPWQMLLFALGFAFGLIVALSTLVS